METIHQPTAHQLHLRQLPHNLLICNRISYRYQIHLYQKTEFDFNTYKSVTFVTHERNEPF